MGKGDQAGEAVSEEDLIKPAPPEGDKVWLPGKLWVLACARGQSAVGGLSTPFPGIG